MPRKVDPRKRIAVLRDQIAALDYVCTGTLLKRMKVCGKVGCACASDPAARHGPYYEWGHMKGGRLVHRTITPAQAGLLQTAIANYRKVKKLLRAWEAESERVIDDKTAP